MTDTKPEVKLLPCPFCAGSKLNEFEYFNMSAASGTQMVQCLTCRSEAPLMRWNVRPASLLPATGDPVKPVKYYIPLTGCDREFLRMQEVDGGPLTWVPSEDYDALSAKVKALEGENEVLREQNFAMNKAIAELQRDLEASRGERDGAYEVLGHARAELMCLGQDLQEIHDYKRDRPTALLDPDLIEEIDSVLPQPTQQAGG